MVIGQSCFSFQNSRRDLDSSYKMDLDLWDCLESIKLVLWQNFIGLIWLYVVTLEGGKRRPWAEWMQYTLEMRVNTLLFTSTEYEAF